MNSEPNVRLPRRYDMAGYVRINRSASTETYTAVLTLSCHVCGALIDCFESMPYPSYFMAETNKERIVSATPATQEAIIARPLSHTCGRPKEEK